MESDAEREEMVRRLVRDDSLGPEEKSKFMSDLYLKGYNTKRMEEKASKMEQAKALQREKSFRDEEEGKLGCKHYTRNVKILADCCGLYFPCRFCHDESCDHEIDRFATKTVMCQECKEEQPVAEVCRSCHIKFASYFCERCRLYDDDPDKQIYHCDQCGICRVGKGIGIDVFHCNRCHACVDLSSANNHHCLENCLQVDCPICGEFLFTSTQPGIFLRCGHTMHAHCFETYIESNFKCPFCFKSILDKEFLHAFNQEMDNRMALEYVPEEYSSIRSQVLCNDCESKTNASFHFFHHKCANCGGYNTRVIGTVR